MRFKRVLCLNPTKIYKNPLNPEFDAWRWNDYWVPLDVVVEFKRGVYEMALIELARFLPRPEYRNRFLRGGMRAREHGDLPPIGVQEHPPAAAAFERPPGLALEGIARPALTPRKDP